MSFAIGQLPSGVSGCPGAGADGETQPNIKEANMTNTERRYLPFGQEMRAVDEDGKMIIEGYPIVYDVYADIWGFREIIRPGAATKALKTANELVLWDHESSKPMARRKNGTLEVKEDDHGVFIRADVSGTRWGRDGYESVKNGITEEMVAQYAPEVMHQVFG